MSLNHAQARAVMDMVDTHVEPIRTVDKVIIIGGTLVSVVLLAMLALPANYFSFV